MKKLIDGYIYIDTMFLHWNTQHVKMSSQISPNQPMDSK